MNGIFQKVRDFFLRSPLPLAAVQIHSRYVCGVRVSHKDRQLKSRFILPLEEGAVLPSYAGPCIKDRPGLERILRQGKDRLGLNGQPVALLLPDMCQRLFVFSFDSLPGRQQDRARIIQFRVQKQMPMLAADSRLAFHGFKSSGKERVIASIARNAVIREFETVMSSCGMDAGAVETPVAGLYRSVDWDRKKNDLLVNIEVDALSLLAVAKGEIVLARQKAVHLGSVDMSPDSHEMKTIIQEIDNTAKFIEDHEKQSIDRLRIRVGYIEGEDKLLAGLKSGLGFPVKEISPRKKLSLGSKERRVLSPLLGQVFHP